MRFIRLSLNLSQNMQFNPLLKSNQADFAARWMSPKILPPLF